MNVSLLATTSRAERPDPTKYSECGSPWAVNALRSPNQSDTAAIPAWIPPNTHDNDLWHATGLASGEHQVRVLTRADRDERSTGNEVVLERAIVYGR